MPTLSCGIIHCSAQKMKFLNIDLEITSRRRPTALLADFADRVLVLHDGKVAGGYFTAVELSSCPKTESKVLARILSLLAGLTKNGKEELAKARVKRIDIGYSKAKGERFEHAFSPAILREVADLGCELAITIYEEKARPNQPLQRTPGKASLPSAKSGARRR
jgi:hypothetical protein